MKANIDLDVGRKTSIRVSYLGCVVLLLNPHLSS